MPSWASRSVIACCKRVRLIVPCRISKLPLPGAPTGGKFGLGVAKKVIGQAVGVGRYSVCGVVLELLVY